MDRIANQARGYSASDLAAMAPQVQMFNMIVMIVKIVVIIIGVVLLWLFIRDKHWDSYSWILFTTVFAGSAAYIVYGYVMPQPRY